MTVVVTDPLYVKLAEVCREMIENHDLNQAGKQNPRLFFWNVEQVRTLLKVIDDGK